MLQCVALFRVACCLLSMAAAADWDDALSASAQFPRGLALSVSKSIAATAQRTFLSKSSASQTRTECSNCNAKAYSTPCPAMWTENPDGTCQAPANYKGVCAARQTFLGVSTLDKREAEVACEFCWPCFDEVRCEKNWNRPCPHGYSAEPIDFDAYRQTTGPTCVVDAGYEGGCEALMQFSVLDDKKELVDRCSVSWPCRSTCEADGSTCPIDWTHIGEGVCAAPMYFKAEGCQLLQGFQGWTPSMKSEYAQKCGVVWQCQATSDVDVVDGPSPLGEGACKHSNMASCPLAWTSAADGICNPPRFSSGPCAQPLHAASMTVEEKLRWAGDCLLSWPCNDGVESGPRIPWNVHAPEDGPFPQ